MYSELNINSLVVAEVASFVGIPGPIDFPSKTEEKERLQVNTAFKPGRIYNIHICIYICMLLSTKN